MQLNSQSVPPFYPVLLMNIERFSTVHASKQAYFCSIFGLTMVSSNFTSKYASFRIQHFLAYVTCQHVLRVPHLSYASTSEIIFKYFPTHFGLDACSSAYILAFSPILILCSSLFFRFLIASATLSGWPA